jgi:hypothetical protein
MTKFPNVYFSFSPSIGGPAATMAALTFETLEIRSPSSSYEGGRSVEKLRGGSPGRRAGSSGAAAGIGGWDGRTDSVRGRTGGYDG